MIKTDQNLKVLEKKIRQAISLIHEMKEERTLSEEDEIVVESLEDLPLLQGLKSPEETDREIKQLLLERQKIRKRIQAVKSEIEKLMT
jgi:cell division septal protein FtsQ